MSQESGTIGLSIVIPAKNEASAIGEVVSAARTAYPDAEILVVDDGSSDETARIAEQAGAIVVRHPESLGNGAAVKTGARAAQGEILALMDGDGQHDAHEFGRLIAKLDQGYQMAIGTRDSGSHANVGRLLANVSFNKLASVISGSRIQDLTSGFRVVRAALFQRYLYLLPNGFSYPTTITMAFLRSGYPICFEPIAVAERKGKSKSHIQPMRDGIRGLIIIFKIATLYSPLKIFLPISSVFLFAGLSHYAYTYFTAGRFTNMSLLALSAAVIICLIGLISEQITTLTYNKP